MNAITKAQSGWWYPPDQSGNGFDIRVIGDIVAICVCLGKVPPLYGQPIWFFCQGKLGDTSFPLLSPNAVLGVPQDQVLTQVGVVTLDVQGDTIVANLTINPPPGGFSPPPPVVKATLNLVSIFLDAQP